MITVEQVSKSYGSAQALSSVSFQANPGRITGFLGPNGAGKSTAMRIICGLSKPSSGRALINGQLLSEVHNPSRVVGALLDAGSQHDGRTGYESLTLGAIAMGVPRTRVDEVLEMVGLTPKEAKRRVGAYSLGMRQRLGIANALLGSPQILIFDEPVNGLDPSGIRWIRDLLRDFANNGGTVLLSSHLLMEIEAIADDLVVIGQGRVVAQGTKEELLAGGETHATAVDTFELDKALKARGFTAGPDGTGGLKTSASPQEVGEVALANQIVLTALSEGSRGGLEDLFFDLTKDTSREGANA
ncbi:ABC transporter ATP-binding protein [Timonella sp. A28]|uniref:ABC transporter ATP-binding protein n=1 Tax=Timonella sp. A28 TaxID=3442640 RepID=UPI003EB92104